MVMYVKICVFLAISTSTALAKSFIYNYYAKDSCTADKVVQLEAQPKDECILKSGTTYRKFTCSGTPPNDVVTQKEYSDSACQNEVPNSMLVYGDTGSMQRTSDGNKNACVTAPGKTKLKVWWSCKWESLPSNDKGWFTQSEFTGTSTCSKNDIKKSLWIYKLDSCFEKKGGSGIYEKPMKLGNSGGDGLKGKRMYCSDSTCSSCTEKENLWAKACSDTSNQKGAVCKGALSTIDDALPPVCGVNVTTTTTVTPAVNTTMAQATADDAVDKGRLSFLALCPLLMLAVGPPA